MFKGESVARTKYQQEKNEVSRYAPTCEKFLTVTTNITGFKKLVFDGYWKQQLMAVTYLGSDGEPRPSYNMFIHHPLHSTKFYIG